MKVYKNIFLLFIGLSIGLVAFASDAKAISDNAHTSIVKIKTFTLNEDYKLSMISEGTGVVIDPSGIVLTNRHVVMTEDDLDGTEKDMAYIICLSEETSAEPSCIYEGRLISSSKVLDIALLKIYNISGYSNKSIFKYLSFGTSDTTKTGDKITALGYPSIGGDNITVTQGIISGKESKHGGNWLKTDAVISYGNSGGALIDEGERVVGITTSVHSDLLGSLGYAINSASINSWVSEFIIQYPKKSPLSDRVVSLAKQMISIKDSNTIIWNFKSSGDESTGGIANLSMIKTSDWKFTFEDEVVLLIDNMQDPGSSGIAVAADHFPYAISVGMVDSMYKNVFNKMFWFAGLENIELIRSEDITISGIRGKKMAISIASNLVINAIFLPVNNYMAMIVYDYGEDDKHKAEVDSIINSTIINVPGGFSEVAEYSNGEPKFSITANNDWFFSKNNSKSFPLSMFNKGNGLAAGEVSIDKIKINMNNDEYLKILESGFGKDGVKQLLNKNAHLRLNGDFGDVVMIDYVTTNSKDSSKIIIQSREYHIKMENKNVVFVVDYLGGDVIAYNNIASGFENMLKASLRINYSSMQSQPTASSQITEGSIVKSYNNEDVYIIRSGKRIKINSPEEFERRGFRWDQIKIVSQEELSGLMIAQSASYANGTLVRFMGSPDIYVIVGGRKRKIPNPESFNNWGYRWDQVKEITSDEIVSIDDISIPSDIVVAIGAKEGSKIYRIIGDKKLWIPTIKAFLDSGYKPSSEVAIPLSDINSFEDVRYIKVKNRKSVYEIKGDKKYLIKDTSKISTSEIKTVTLAESNAYPTGK